MGVILKAGKDLILKIMTFYMRHAERIVGGCYSAAKECHTEIMQLGIIEIKESNNE